MKWTVELLPEAQAALKKIGTSEAKRVLKFLSALAKRENPRELGAALKGHLKDFWRYRVGDYRIICNLENATLTVLVIRIGHRSSVYKE